MSTTCQKQRDRGGIQREEKKRDAEVRKISAIRYEGETEIRRERESESESENDNEADAHGG